MGKTSVKYSYILNCQKKNCTYKRVSIFRSFLHGRRISVKDNRMGMMEKEREQRKNETKGEWVLASYSGADAERRVNA